MMTIIEKNNKYLCDKPAGATVGVMICLCQVSSHGSLLTLRPSDPCRPGTLSLGCCHNRILH